MNYIDKKVALQYLANSEKLFAKFKATFISTYKDAATEISRLSADRNVDELHSYIHTIKGASLNIGSSILYDDCVAVLQKLEKGEINSSLIEQVIHTIRMCVSELESL